MARPEITPETMESERTARFNDLTPSLAAFVDTRIPEHEREIFNVIGRGVTEDPDLAPAISDAKNFNVTYVRCKPGTGAALHSHPTVEVFFVMDGRFDVIWGDGGKHRATLEKFDIISVPVGVMRGFENTGTGEGLLMAILGGDDAGYVEWDPAVLARAKETGMEIAADGTLVMS
jgi:mannose-6-phosphate isomerase-like protein (cupin superfamily)